ncbi:NAC domain-containing protein 40-like [Diospyros lotus]|uniref:NAC domain-containing protein 40-like n=1 Tax=Diospyros lotus TaxID=55363 RepID=UPI0022554AF6|nr:NAC domain-containing protein 40-like [Diospyros lotus]
MGEGSRREMELSIETSSMFPGFRFSPNDEELISFYLSKKLQGCDECVEVIAEVDLCKYDPWDLPAKAVIQSDNEWFFFSPRGRKYPNGTQSKRATESGYWKATGKERNVKSGSNAIGTKRTLVFHKGRAPKGERTEWIMHELCMNGMSQDSLVVCRLRKNYDFRLNDGQSSSSGRQLQTEGDGNVNSLEADVIEQSGIPEGAKAVESCSKEGSSSYTSHSVQEQTDSGYESNQNLTRECSEPGSSSYQVGDEGYCYDDFADIMEDDIVTLDGSLLAPTPNLLPAAADKKSEDQRPPQEHVQETSLHLDPLQGAANRRIRFRRQTPETGNFEPVEVDASNRHSIEELTRPSPEQPPKCILSLVSDRGVSRSTRSLVFIFLGLLLVFVSLLEVPWQRKGFKYPSL